MCVFSGCNAFMHSFSSENSQKQVLKMSANDDISAFWLADKRGVHAEVNKQRGEEM